MAVDIKQLRVGSHVLLTCENKRVRIDGITNRKIGYHRRADRTDHLAYARMNEIEPMPITPELLVELGFEKVEEFVNAYRFIKADIDVQFVIYGERIAVKVKQNDNHYPAILVRYLHEIENFIYLTLGKELIEE